jgi:hypothetical protein
VVVGGDFTTFVIDIDVFSLADVSHLGLADPGQDRIFDGNRFV